MKIVLLDTETLGEDSNLKVFEAFGTVNYYATTLTKQETIQRLQDATVVITNKVIIDKDILDHTPTLKLICVAATGMNNIDIPYATQKGIQVKNVSGYSTHSVVQHTFAMLFFLLEKMHYYHHYVESGQWSKSPIFTHLKEPFHEIYGKKWGIIGFGQIGQEVAKVATSFGAEVSYYSTSGKNLKHAYPHKSLEFILKDSDIISIHAPLNEQTYELINEINLPFIKEDAILLNLGRGGIIDETDLSYELDRKRFYAGLDVLEKEPIEPFNRLNEIQHKERLLLTPHIAWGSVEARQKLIQGIVENITIFLNQKV